VDIRGNPYGLLAAHPLAPLVSLHHLDYVQSLFPNVTQKDSVKKLITAYEMDPARTLQQTFCYDTRRKWSVSVSWGYTVQLFPSLVTAQKLETAFQTFRTWKGGTSRLFTFNTRPVSADPCERPILYYLDRVERVGQDSTLTTYKRSVNKWEEGCERSEYARAFAVRSFNISAPNFNPDLWKKVILCEHYSLADKNCTKRSKLDVLYFATPIDLIGKCFLQANNSDHKYKRLSTRHDLYVFFGQVNVIISVSYLFSNSNNKLLSFKILLTQY
jgi:hypothetical protein